MSETRKVELVKAEDEGWIEVNGLVESLPPAHIEEKGYFPEWSVKDLVGHLGAWMAEAGVSLERIRMGTYRPEHQDVDELNARFFDAMKDQPFGVVRAECWSARNRMLVEWDLLPEVTTPAEEWFAESGPAHYDEHVPRLREWVEELRARA
jgi:Mycothiol maleylpyruvate isomerase N-terminal domain